VAENTNLKLLVAGVMLSFLVGTPSLAPAKEEGKSHSHALRVQLINTLNLNVYKEKMFIAVEEKYDRIRQEALERITKSEEQLEKLLSGDKPDERKVKVLITAISSDQDILVNTYKGRRDEILAMLTPVQQGVYLSITWKWQQKLLETYGKPKTGQQDEKKKVKAP
jgi:Spy/CpxP family protein refolding chaperone